MEMSTKGNSDRFRDAEGTLQILLRVAASTSFLCSFLLMVNILRDAKTKLKHIYQRLLLGLSICDLISSSNLSQAGWVAEYHASCQINGLLSHFAIAAGLYNAMLCLHFMLIICYEWSPTKFAQRKWVEYLMHTLAIGWPLSFGIVGLCLQAYGDIRFVPQTCTWDQYPAGRCYECDFHYEVPAAVWLEVVAMVLPAILSFIVILYTLVRIFWHVFQQEQKQMKYQFEMTTARTQDTQPRRFTLPSIRQSATTNTTTTIEAENSHQRAQRRLLVPVAPPMHHAPMNDIDNLRRPRQSHPSLAVHAMQPSNATSEQASDNNNSATEIVSMPPSERPTPRRLSFPITSLLRLNKPTCTDDDADSPPPHTQRRFSLQSMRRSVTNGNSQQQKRKFRKCKEAAIQAGLFILAHLLTYTPTLVAFGMLNFAYQPYTNYNMVALASIVCFFFPLQGFWNLIIYARPRFKNLRHKHPDKSLIILIAMSIWQRSNNKQGRKKIMKTFTRTKTKLSRLKAKHEDIWQEADQAQDDFSRMMSQPLDMDLVENPATSGAIDLSVEERKEEEEEKASIGVNSDFADSGVELQRNYDAQDETSVAPFDENFEFDDHDVTDRNSEESSV